MLSQMDFASCGLELPLKIFTNVENKKSATGGGDDLRHACGGSEVTGRFGKREFGGQGPPANPTSEEYPPLGHWCAAG